MSISWRVRHIAFCVGWREGVWDPFAQDDTAERWARDAVSHPKRKNKDALRVGHPRVMVSLRTATARTTADPSLITPATKTCRRGPRLRSGRQLSWVGED